MYSHTRLIILSWKQSFIKKQNGRTRWISCDYNLFGEPKTHWHYVWRLVAKTSWMDIIDFNWNMMSIRNKCDWNIQKFMLPKRRFWNVEKYSGKTFCKHFSYSQLLYLLKDSSNMRCDVLVFCDATIFCSNVARWNKDSIRCGGFLGCYDLFNLILL